MTTDIKVDGFKELDKLLNSLPDEIAQKVGEASLRSGAKVFLEEAKRLVPNSKGSLLKSLGIKSIKSTNPYIRVIARRGKGLGGWHANLVEYGTKPHDIHNVFLNGHFYPVVHHPGTPPSPFLRPAFANKKMDALKKVGEDLTKHIVNKLKKAK